MNLNLFDTEPMEGRRIYATPDHIFQAADLEFNFSIDLCADAGNAKCKKFFSTATSLSREWAWRGWAWMNPPYGKEIIDWVKKAAECRYPIVALIPARTNAPWWHDYVLDMALEVRLSGERLASWHPMERKVRRRGDQRWCCSRSTKKPR